MANKKTNKIIILSINTHPEVRAQALGQGLGGRVGYKLHQRKATAKSDRNAVQHNIFAEAKSCGEIPKSVRFCMSPNDYVQVTTGNHKDTSSQLLLWPLESVPTKKCCTVLSVLVRGL